MMARLRILRVITLLPAKAARGRGYALEIVGWQGEPPDLTGLQHPAARKSSPTQDKIPRISRTGWAPAPPFPPIRRLPGGITCLTGHGSQYSVTPRRRGALPRGAHRSNSTHTMAAKIYTNKDAT